uniref:Serrate RNA effector molecule homolog n=1 Tax=Caenorhabditis tropicalis TaxID=1561998 RepID=A0A1I7TR42_9PELO
MDKRELYRDHIQQHGAGSSRGRDRGNGHRDQGENRRFHRRKENEGMWNENSREELGSRKRFRDERQDEDRMQEQASSGGYRSRGGAYQGDYRRSDDQEDRASDGYQRSRYQEARSYRHHEDMDEERHRQRGNESPNSRLSVFRRITHRNSVEDQDYDPQEGYYSRNGHDSTTERFRNFESSSRQDYRSTEPKKGRYSQSGSQMSSWYRNPDRDLDNQGGFDSHGRYGSHDGHAMGSYQNFHSSYHRGNSHGAYGFQKQRARYWKGKKITLNADQIRKHLALLDKDDDAQEQKLERLEEMRKNGGKSLLIDEARWSAYYRKSSEFSESVRRLAEIRSVDEKEAEKQLLDILNKATLIEIHLMMHGQKTAEQLFRRMQYPNQKKAWHEEQDKKQGSSCAQRLVQHVPDSDSEGEIHSDEDEEHEGYEQKIPFCSAQELFEFMKELIPVFKYHPSSGKWQNTGHQTRRFFQWLKRKMDGGRVFNWDNFEEVDYPQFKATIEVQEEMKAFAERELMMDYSSFEEFGLQIPGFFYDFDSKMLSLTGQASSRIALNIPIVVALFHTSTPLNMDCSREWEGLITPFICSTMQLSHYIGVTGAMKGLKIAAFVHKFNQKPCQVSMAPIVFASGFLWPGSTIHSGEVFRMEGVEIDYFQRMDQGLSTFETGHPNEFRKGNIMTKKEMLAVLEEEEDQPRNHPSTSYDYPYDDISDDDFDMV